MRTGMNWWSSLEVIIIQNLKGLVKWNAEEEEMFCLNRVRKGED